MEGRGSVAELDLIEVLKIARSNSRRLVLGSVSLALIALAAASLIPSRYSYMALVQSALIDIPHTETRTSFLAQVILGKRNQPVAMKAQGVQYLEFRYVNAPRGFLPAAPYVRTVENYPNNDLFSITVHAASLEEAQKYTHSVVNELRGYFSPFVEGARKEMLERASLLERKIASLSVGIGSLGRADASGPVGMKDPQALKLEAEADLISAELELASLRAAASPERLRNFTLIDHHPASLAPVFPRPVLVSLLICGGSATVLLTLIVLSEQRRRRLGLVASYA